MAWRVGPPRVGLVPAGLGSLLRPTPRVALPEGFPHNCNLISRCADAMQGPFQNRLTVRRTHQMHSRNPPATQAAASCNGENERDATAAGRSLQHPINVRLTTVIGHCRTVVKASYRPSGEANQVEAEKIRDKLMIGNDAGGQTG